MGFVNRPYSTRRHLEIAAARIKYKYNGGYHDLSTCKYTKQMRVLLSSKKVIYFLGNIERDCKSEVNELLKIVIKNYRPGRSSCLAFEKYMRSKMWRLKDKYKKSEDVSFVVFSLKELAYMRETAKFMGLKK